MGKQWKHWLTIFEGSKITEMVTAAMKLKTLAPWTRAMTNPDSILKGRDITLPTRVHVVKAIIFSVVQYYISQVDYYITVVKSDINKHQT